MRKTIAFVLAAAMLLSMAACNQTGTTNPQTSTTQPTQTQLTEPKPTESQPKEHTHSYTETVAAPTCTEKGYTIYTCVCGDSYKDKEVAAAGHVWGEWVTTKEPTEETEGAAERSCSNCSEKETKALAKIDHVHKYSEKVTAPTCTEKGYTTHTCACGHSYRDKETAATGHKWSEWKTTKEPTEETEGVAERSCSNCSEKETKSLAKLDHVHKYSEKVTAPTCTEKGYTIYTCVCGDSYKDKEVAAAGHVWGEWVTTKEPTEETEGAAERSCANCSEKETKALPVLTDEELWSILKKVSKSYAYADLSSNDGYLLYYSDYKNLPLDFVVEFLTKAVDVSQYGTRIDDGLDWQWTYEYVLPVDFLNSMSSVILGCTYEFEKIKPESNWYCSFSYDADRQSVVHTVTNTGAGGVGFEFIDYERLDNGDYRCYQASVDMYYYSSVQVMTLRRQENDYWRIVSYETYKPGDVAAIADKFATAQQQVLAFNAGAAALSAADYQALTAQQAAEMLLYACDWKQYLLNDIYCVPLETVEMCAMEILGGNFDFASLNSDSVRYEASSNSLLLTKKPITDEFYYDCYCYKQIEDSRYLCYIQYESGEPFAYSLGTVTLELLDNGQWRLVGYDVAQVH